jgi:hypothetical protein
MHQMRISTTLSLFSGTWAEKLGSPKHCENCIKAE